MRYGSNSTVSTINISGFGEQMKDPLILAMDHVTNFEIAL